MDDSACIGGDTKMVGLYFRHVRENNEGVRGGRIGWHFGSSVNADGEGANESARTCHVGVCDYFCFRAAFSRSASLLRRMAGRTMCVFYFV